jgi:hypothetical protein
MAAFGVFLIIIGIVVLVMGPIAAPHQYPHGKPYTIVHHGDDCWTYIEWDGGVCGVDYKTREAAESTMRQHKQFVYDYHHGLREQLDAKEKVRSEPGYFTPVE